MDSDNSLLELYRVSKKLSGKRIIRSASFAVNKGDFFGLIGPNGAGKSSLLNIIVTLAKKTSGTIYFKGRDTTKKTNSYRKSIGYAPQHTCFYKELTVLENMNNFAMMYDCKKNKSRHTINELLSLVDLKESKNILAKDLSGGMQRRLNIACSLIHNPELVILDEPAANLDHHQREEIWKLLTSINQRGVTIIISSHLLHDMNRLCNRVAFMFKGSVLFTGTPQELQDKFKRNVIVHLSTVPGNYGMIISALRPALIINSHDVKDNILTMNITNTNYAIHQMVHILDELGEYIADIEVEKPSLDDTFEEIIRRFGQ